MDESPTDEWERLPPVKDEDCVYLDISGTVEGELHGYRIPVTIGSAFSFTRMPYTLGLLSKIECYIPMNVNTCGVSNEIACAKAKEVTVTLNSKIRLTTDIYILPESESQMK